MSTDEYRVLLKTAHEYADRCAKLARSLYRLIRSTHHLPVDGEHKFTTDFISLALANRALSAAGDALRQAQQETIGIISTAGSPITEHQQIWDYTARFVALIMIQSKISRLQPEDESQFAWVRGLLKTHYREVHLNIACEKMLSVGSPQSLAQCHDTAWREWLAISAALQKQPKTGGRYPERDAEIIRLMKEKAGRKPGQIAKLICASNPEWATMENGKPLSAGAIRSVLSRARKDRLI